MFNNLDLFFPKFNLGFDSFDSYLSYTNIEALRPRLKPIKKSQKDYVSGIFVLSHYSNEVINNLIQRAKFGGEFVVAKDFAKALKYKIIEDGEVFVPDPDLIVYVPHDPKRILTRGYNLSAHISRELGILLRVDNINILRKIRGTTPQTSLNREGRENNLKGVFEIDKNVVYNLSKVENIWLIDDISTTGATIFECAKTIKKQYPFVQIWGIVIASN
jgi:ComF family protein